MYGVMRFWLDRSVDGFRIDAIGCIAKDPLFRDNPPNRVLKNSVYAVHWA